MKHPSFPVIVILLLCCHISFAQNSDNRKLWLLTARVSHNSTFRQDTTKSFNAGGKNWSEEKHSSSKTTATGTVSGVIENQADDPAKDFVFHSDAGDPVNFLVTGQGSHSASSDYLETIDGKMISADRRNDNVSGSAWPGASVYFEFSSDTKSFGINMGIKAVGSFQGKRFDGEWKDYDGKYKDYSIHMGGGGDLGTDRNCKITKTGTGYQAMWKESGSKQRSTVDGMENSTYENSVEVTIVPYKESDKPVVTINGCTNPGIGENETVTASGKPGGGSYKFRVEPSDLMTVASGGASAILTGKMPGRGTLYVEYTTPDGKTAQTSTGVSCVRVDTYNGGQPLPQLALYDINGKKQNALRTVPVQAQPSDASDLLRFEPANVAILSAVGTGSEVTLQGLREGKTTLVAKTKCGEKTGPAVEVEVVNCDDETKAKLAEMMKIAMENQKAALEEIEKITDSEEYKEAAENITKSTKELAEKTALTIITGGKTTGKLHEALEITEAVATIKDLLTSQTTENLNFNEMSAMAKATGAKALKAIAGVSEVIKAADEFGKNLGKLMGTEIELKGAMARAENANKQILEVGRLQRICRSSDKTDGSKGTSEPTPKTDQPKPASDPKTGKDQPTSPKPQTQDPGTTEPTTGPPAGDGTKVSPPPPVSQPTRMGLPYEPSSCGCNSQKGIGLSSEGFSLMQTGMDNLGKCVSNFISGPATNFKTSLNELQTITAGLDTAAKSGAEEFKKSSADAIPKLDSILGITKEYEKSGNEFYNEFKACPGSMKTGVEVMGSAKGLKGALIESK